MINQLFKREPTQKELILIINCFNLKSLEDDKTISFLEMTYYNTINKIYSILDILLDIYLPCKYYYLNKLTNKKCITILRQIIKIFDRKLELKFIVTDKIKIISFNIYNSNINKIKIKKNITITF